MATKDKGLNRGGGLGQEGELGPNLERNQQEDVGKRDRQKQRGGIGREPNLDQQKTPQGDQPPKQPTHIAD